MRVQSEIPLVGAHNKLVCFWWNGPRRPSLLHPIWDKSPLFPAHHCARCAAPLNWGIHLHYSPTLGLLGEEGGCCWTSPRRRTTTASHIIIIIIFIFNEATYPQSLSVLAVNKSQMSCGTKSLQWIIYSKQRHSLSRETVCRPNCCLWDADVLKLCFSWGLKSLQLHTVTPS